MALRSLRSVLDPSVAAGSVPGAAGASFRLVPHALLLLLAACGGDGNPVEPTPSSPPPPPPAPGAVSIVVDPPGLPAPWRLAGPGGMSQEGTGAASLTGVAAGQYTLTWNPLDGWDPPDPAERSLTLEPAGVIGFSGAYARWTGRIEIGVEGEGVAGPWTLDGPDGFGHQGAGSFTFEYVPVGEYGIQWGPVEGFVTPAPEREEGVLTRDGTLVFTARWDPAVGQVTIRVLPEGLEAPWVLTGPSGFQVEGAGTRTLTGLDAGPYEVVWGDLVGWLPPLSPLGETLPPGGSVVMEGTYTAAQAALIIAVDPEESDGAWRLQGPSGEVESGRGSRTLQGLSPAEYTLTWRATQGWELPEPTSVTVTLPAGGSETVRGTFRVPSASLEVSLRPRAIPAPWRLTDPFGADRMGEGVDVLGRLQSGRYRMTWMDILGWDTPPAVEIEIGEGQRASVHGLYPLMADPFASADSLSRAVSLGGAALVHPDSGTVVLEAPLARLDEDGRSRFFAFTSERGSFIAIRAEPLESFGHPLDAQDLAIRLWRQASDGSASWTLLGQVNLSPRGLPENHSPIFYAGADFAGDGSWVAEIYGAGERTGRQLFRLRVSNRAISP